MSHKPPNTVWLNLEAFLFLQVLPSRNKLRPYSLHDLRCQTVVNHATVRQFLTKTQINNQVFTLCACMCRWMDMLRCGPAGPKVCVVSVITDSKLPVKYGNLRKRSEEGKIIFAFVSDYFYRYCFHFFDYRYRFRVGLKIIKNSKTISENRRLSFSFSSLVSVV